MGPVLHFRPQQEVPTLGSPIAGSPHYEIGTATDKFLATLLGINKTFTLEIKPASGAVVTLQRTTPPRIDTIMDLN